jgi:hypothetical protein
MRTVLILLGVTVFGSLISFFGISLWQMRDRNFHPWPGVTRCRVCDKRIFAWQSYERRSSTPVFDNPSRVFIRISSYGLYHRSCEGTGKPMDVKVEFGPSVAADS